jgi:MerR family transcriptional regulator, light-induced transcriptional regulator
MRKTPSDPPADPSGRLADASAAPRPPASVSVGRFAPSDAAALARFEGLIRAGRVPEALDLCRSWRASGTTDAAPPSNDALYARLLIPLLHRLESAWTEDSIDFGHLSLAFLNLHRVIMALSDDLRPMQGAGRGRVLVATAPDEDHQFGAQVLADLLRGAGWSVDLALQTDAAELVRRVAQVRYAALALSVGHDGALDGLGDLIATCRAEALHGRMQVLVGGAALVEPRSQYHFLGADLVAHSGAEALGFLSATRSGVLTS